MASKWLVKSEPDTYSYADLERDGRTVWDGVQIDVTERTRLTGN